MIVITDGGDTTSGTGFPEAVKAAHAVDAVIYGIIVMPIKSDAGRNTGGENALKTLAASTGGATFVLSGTENLDEAFQRILRNLRTQYLLGYYPPELRQDGETFRAIEVRVARPGASVLVRSGYYLPDAPRVTTEPARIGIRQRPQATGSSSGSSSGTTKKQ
jgi:Ca-activated chloride channel family protein